MYPDVLSLEDQKALLDNCFASYLKRKFTIVSRSLTTAERYKPARFPEWLFKAESRYIVIDDEGRTYVQKR